GGDDIGQSPDDDLGLNVDSHRDPDRARCSASDLIEDNEASTAATQRFATMRPHNSPNRHRSVCSSPEYRSVAPPSSAVSSNDSTTEGTGPRIKRKSTRCGLLKRTVSTVVVLRPQRTGVECSASTRSVPRSRTRSF